MGEFKQALESKNLYDLVWKGDSFTQSNKHDNVTFNKKMLDKNPQWSNIYRDSGVEVLDTIKFDHKPLLLALSGDKLVYKNEEKSLDLKLNGREMQKARCWL